MTEQIKILYRQLECIPRDTEVLWIQPKKCFHRILEKTVVGLSWLLATQPTKRGIHGLVYIEPNIVCSQCLFLGCKNQCSSFNFQVTFPSPLPGLIFVNCLRHFPCKLTMHYYYHYYYYNFECTCKIWLEILFDQCFSLFLSFFRKSFATV